MDGGDEWQQLVVAAIPWLHRYPQSEYGLCGSET